MKAIALATVVLIAAAVGLPAQDLLGAAKDLYASAAYEDALSTLSRIEPSAAPDVARQADEYRAFCLYALGRTAEAEVVVETLIRREPSATLNGVDVSPRLEQMFTAVRKKLLPSLIRDRFRLARTALDQKHFSEAESILVEARRLYADAAEIGLADETLADLNLLIDGFLQLVRTTVEHKSAVTPPSAPSPPPAAPAPPPAAPRLYSAEDTDVVPPGTIEQRMPALSDEMTLIARVWNANSTLRLVIDENGRVIDASMRPQLSRSIDAMIVSAARQWRFTPARKDGVPVRYVKMFALVL